MVSMLLLLMHVYYCMHTPRRIKLKLSHCLISFQDVQVQQNGHKQPCPAGYEYYCLNGGECFSITIAGHSARACQ